MVDANVPAARPGASPIRGSAASARQVSVADTFKALADPLRLAILSALMQDVDGLRLMSVKELANELGEPQTKLYRHIKHLEAADLIRVGATRTVSGITEQRYQACQASLSFGPEIVHDSRQSDEATAMVTALMERYLSRFFANQPPAAEESRQEDRQDVMWLTSARVPLRTAQLVRARLQTVIEALEQSPPGDETGVQVEVLLGFFSPVQRTPRPDE